MKISVAIAAYCGEKFIAEQLESLAAQTRVPDEVIICDDSPDDLTEIAVRPLAEKLGIRYFRNPGQLGVNRNFEKAISLCSGDIIFLCDQDDVWLPEKISKMSRIFENDPAVSGVFCDSLVSDEDLRPCGFSLWQMRGFSPAMQKKFNSGRQLEVFLKRVTCSTHNIAIRRSVLKNALPFPYLDPFYADTFFGLLLASSGSWKAVSEKLTLYRVHANTLSSPKLANLREQATLSRKARQKSALRRTAELGGELLERLPDDTAPEIRNKIENFCRHYSVRNSYSGNIFIRTVQVIREIFTLRYSRCSNGWKSVAADIFLF